MSTLTQRKPLQMPTETQPNANEINVQVEERRDTNAADIGVAQPIITSTATSVSIGTYVL